MRPTYLVLFLILTFAFSSHSTVSAQDGPFARLFSGERPSGSHKNPGYSAFGGPKRVEINLTQQKLKAYQGNRLVMVTKISSGKNRGTPTGNFRAGPYKNEEHYSSLYHNAPMPWSTQVTGHIFIHGYSVVPDFPASHGCIRVPVSGRNPAKKLYRWLDVGTPIRIHY